MEDQELEQVRLLSKLHDSCMNVLTSVSSLL